MTKLSENLSNSTTSAFEIFGDVEIMDKKMYCDRIADGALFSEEVEDTFYFIMGCIGPICFLLVGSTMFLDEKLRTHPQLLVSISLLVMGAYQNLLLSTILICGGGNLQVLTAWTLY